MTQAEIDVLTIGNAIVDVIAKVDDAFVQKNGLVKGSMNLIDEQRAEELYASMGPAIEISGGSAGNTAAGVASFGGGQPICDGFVTVRGGCHERPVGRSTWETSRRRTRAVPARSVARTRSARSCALRRVSGLR